MTTENKIKCVLIDFEINKITLQEATEQILLLLNIVGRSEQLCDHPEAVVRDTVHYRHCMKCGKKF